MSVRFRIGPFTFGKTGTRLSIWRRGSGFSVPLFSKKNRAFAKIKLGMFSFYFNKKSRKKKIKQTKNENVPEINGRN